MAKFIKTNGIYYKDNSEDYVCIKKALKKLLNDEDYNDLTSSGNYATIN